MLSDGIIIETYDPTAIIHLFTRQAHIMITGDIKNKIDQIWNAFWSGGISNPLEVMEQMTYLLFIRRLDEIQTTAEKKALRTKKEIANPIFSAEQQHLRWSSFTNLGDAQALYNLISEQVFPFIKTIGEGGSAYSRHMKYARFTIPTPALLTKVIDLLAEIPMNDQDTKGDIYEYMLGKIASAGQNGQFRTPRHIIKMMVELMQPKPTDTICDPACGTAGFLVAASEYLNQHHSTEIFANPDNAKRYNENTFFGYDFDSTMLRIGTMNMLLHGVSHPNIENRDSLSDLHSQISDKYSLILANPPFAGSLDYESCAKNLLEIIKTKKTELLFVALFLRLLKTGGSVAAIVPDGVLFGSSTAHKTLRQKIVEEQQLKAIISMPSGVFKPYAGVSTAIMIFTKTNSGGTDKVWFYDMQADGYSLDDKRNELDSSKHENNNIPDIIRRWRNLDGETGRLKTEQSFFVSKDESVKAGYDLSINRYKEVVYEQIQYDPPEKIIAELEQLESEIQQGMTELKAMLRP